MMEKAFDLLREPWIRVITNDMHQKEISLLDVLVNSHEYRFLSGESSTQDVSLFRMLLAITETIFYRYEPDGTENLLNEDDSDEDDVIERWRQYYEIGAFRAETIVDYLNSYSERFWLFHPETPFYQVAGLGFGTDYGADCLIGNIKESNNSATKHHFSLAEGSNIQILSYAEAARWLINFNSYSVNVKPDPKIPDGEKGAGTGRLGKLGFIMAVGNNLFETLMLNLCALKDGKEIWGNPCPAWEQQPASDLHTREISVPDNIPEAYTIQSRRVCLKQDENGHVFGFRAKGGDYYSMENDISEQMTIWKYNIDKKTKKKTYKPQLHDPDVFIWREFPIIFCNDNAKETSARMPGLIRWLERLVAEELISADKLLTIRAVGLIYGDGMSYTLGDCVNDNLSLSMSLLQDKNMIWLTLISDEIGKCKDLADRIRYFSDEAGILLYGNDKGKKTAESKKLIQTFYFHLDDMFRKWLSGIDPSNDSMDEKIKEWEQIAASAAKRVVKDHVSAMGNNIYRCKTDKKNQLISVPGLMNKFFYQISNLYPGI